MRAAVDSSSPHRARGERFFVHCRDSKRSTDCWIIAYLQNKESHARYLIVRNCLGSHSQPNRIVSAFSRFSSRIWNAPSATRTRRKEPEVRKEASPNTSGRILDDDNATGHPSQPMNEPVDDKDNREPFESSEPALHLETRKSDPEDQFKADLEEFFLAAHRDAVSQHRELKNRNCKAQVLEVAMTNASSGSIFDSHYPYVAALCKPWYVQFNLVMMVLCLVNLLEVSAFTSQDNVIHAYHFRFTALQLRGGEDLAIARPELTSQWTFGLMTNGCSDHLAETPFNFTRHAAGRTLSYAAPVAMNGWYFSSGSSAHPENDPVRFTLECSDNMEGTAWKQIGSSSFVWTWGGFYLWENGIYRSDEDKNRPFSARFDMSVPARWSHHRVGQRILIVLMFSFMYLALAMGHHLLAKAFVSFFFLCLSLHEGISAWMGIHAADYPFAFLTASFSLTDLQYSLTMTFAESRLRQCFLVSSIGYFIPVLIYYTCLIEYPQGLLEPRCIKESVGLLEGLVVFGLYVYASRAVAHSARMVKEIMALDMSVYDKCWSNMLSRYAGSEAIQMLHELAIKLGQGQLAVIRQRGQPLPVESSADQVSLLQSHGAYKPGPLIDDLDQLLLQAAGLDLFLRRKVQAWALLSNGCFEVANRDGSRSGSMFMRWEQIRGVPELVRSTHFARPKSRVRVIEKLCRCYRMDVSRLTDCCRQSIVFEEISDIHACLQAIHEDSEVVLLRVNNRLHTSYRAEQTAGYRDLQLNLRIVTTETQQLGINMHVCEVQLLLIDFARIKVIALYPHSRVWVEASLILRALAASAISVRIECACAWAGNDKA